MLPGATQETESVCVCIPARLYLQGAGKDSPVDMPVKTASLALITAASPTKRIKIKTRRKNLIRAAECERPALACRMQMKNALNTAGTLSSSWGGGGFILLLNRIDCFFLFFFFKALLS